MINFPSLKGIFPSEPKPHKRDFLKENKLKLKDLQKHKTESQRSSQQKSEQNKLNLNVKEKNIPSISSATINKDLKDSRFRRINSGCSTCTSKKTIITRSASSTTICYDKQIQTDDILDEEFLNNALRRCSSKNIKGQGQHDDYLRLPTDNQSVTTPDIDDLCGINSNNSRFPSSNHNHNHQYQQTDECDKCPDNENVNFDINCNNNDKGLDIQLRDLHLKDSGESQKTILQQRQQQHNDINNKKFRSNIKIPKYLEREKREKELQKFHEMNKDPNCPDGCYALSDHDRQEALRSAKQEYQKLIDELNRMPFSCQTLKMRKRKIYIEKSLSELDKTIQIFSKSKVYIPIKK